MSMASERCEGYWDHGECVGTPYCPPRCPRFFDRQGRAYIVRPVPSDTAANADGDHSGNADAAEADAADADAADADADANASGNTDAGATVDLEGILEMYRDYPDEHRSMGVPPEHEVRLQQWLDRLQERGQHFVATRQGTVVGHACYSPRTADVPEMLVYVDPEYHGRGLGTELTKHVLAYAADAGHDAVALDVDRDNTTAINVYRDLGFELTHETPMEYEMELGTDTAIVMQIRLPPAKRDV